MAVIKEMKLRENKKVFNDKDNIFTSNCTQNTIADLVQFNLVNLENITDLKSILIRFLVLKKLPFSIKLNTIKFPFKLVQK